MACTHENSEEIDALDQALRSLFLSLQARALPDSLRADRLDELFAQLGGVFPAELGAANRGERT